MHRALDGVPALLGRGEGLGSNAFAVSGSRTTTGRPLLANDPHLGVGQPGIWIQNSLHCRSVSPACPLDVSGFSFAGVPGVVIGRNGQIAWGFTNLSPDVTDFYLERVVGDTYLRDGDWEQVTTREEVIKIADGADQRITVRSTVHGPVMSDVVEGVSDAGTRAPTEQEGDETESYAVSLAWTGLIPSRTADAILDLNLATDFRGFREAARAFAVPSQNFVYADRAGHIGYQAPGQVPVRRAALPRTPAGSWPAPGWDSDYDWQRFVDFAEMPWTLDPKDGVVVTANQPVTRSPTPFLTSDWDLGWRATRISERIQALDEVSPDDMAAIQMDDEDTFARVLVPALLAVPLEASESEPDSDGLLEFTREARELLRGWDRTTPAGDGESGAAAAYYNAVWRNLCELLFDDELPQGLKADGGGRYRSAVQQLLTNPKSAWWDDKLTPNVAEGKDEILRRALVEARLELTRELGKDPAKWQWGKLHRPRAGAQGARGRVRARPRAVARQRRAVRHARGLGHRQRQRVERQHRLLGDRGTVDADGRRPRRPRRVDVDQPDRRERPPDRRPLRRPDRRLGGRAPAVLAVHRGGRAGHGPRRSDAQARGRVRHGVSPRSVTPSAVTTASTGWSCGSRGSGWSSRPGASSGCSTTTTGVPGRRRGRALS